MRVSVGTVSVLLPLESAQSYLDSGEFSKKGLIQQLSSSGGEVSRKRTRSSRRKRGRRLEREAVESAQSYLDSGSFSKKSLIEQLSGSGGEGFTKAQARYAVGKVY